MWKKEKKQRTIILKQDPHCMKVPMSLTCDATRICRWHGQTRRNPGLDICSPKCQHHRHQHHIIHPHRASVKRAETASY